VFCKWRSWSFAIERQQLQIIVTVSFGTCSTFKHKNSITYQMSFQQCVHQVSRNSRRERLKYNVVSNLSVVTFCTSVRVLFILSVCIPQQGASNSQYWEWNLKPAHKFKLKVSTYVNSCKEWNLKPAHKFKLKVSTTFVKNEINC